MTGKLDRALEGLVEAAKLGPADGPLCNNIAVLYFKKGEFHPALEYAEKAAAAGYAVDPAFLAEIKKRLSGRDGT
jgi:Flp pilus assembly protein TadD